MQYGLRKRSPHLPVLFLSYVDKDLVVKYIRTLMNDASPLPFVAQAQLHEQRVAIIDHQGAFTYLDLLDASSRVAAVLLASVRDLHEARVGFLITPGFQWVAALWGIWRAGGIAVPLPLNAVRAELEYAIDDAQATF